MFPPTHGEPADAGQSTISFVKGLTLILIAVLGGILGAIWLAEKGGPLQQKADALVRKLDIPDKQPSSNKPAEATVRITVTESAVAATRPAAITPRAIRKTGPAAASGRLTLPSLQAVHWSSQPGRTRVDIELGTATIARSGRLHNPERIYFDLMDGSPRPDPPGRFGVREDARPPDSQLAGIRMARSQSKTVRVVLDLKYSCDISYRLSPKPNPSLVIELASPASTSLMRPTKKGVD